MDSIATETHQTEDPDELARYSSLGDTVSSLESIDAKQSRDKNDTKDDTNSEEASGEAVEESGEAVEAEKNYPLSEKAWLLLGRFYSNNSFMILVVIAVLLAYAYPVLGAVYFYPNVTATWIAVIFIFVMSGMGLKTEQFAKAFRQLRFNLFVQTFNFFAVSVIVFGFSRFMKFTGLLSRSLADGMVICSCLPLTVNMVMVLTKSSGGDEAAAVFNAAFGNILGVFLSPVLVLAYLGVDGAIDLGTVSFKLGLRVLLPIIIGQLLQKIPSVMEFVKKNSKTLSSLQCYTLIFIIYTVFCKTFIEGSDNSLGEIVFMMALQFLMLIVVMALAWYSLKLLFPNKPKLRVMGIYGCSHKTVAMGVPLINAIYENNPLVGYYTLPLLIWHPMQLIIGSFMVPRLAAFVEREEQRLTNEIGNESMADLELSNNQQQKDAANIE